MSAYGFSAFVDGFFKGREYRDAREDKKRQTARQDRMDKILEAREARAADLHGLDMEGRRVRLDSDKLTLDEARRQAANEEEYRRLFRDGMTETGAPEPLGVRPPAASSGTPEADAAVAGVAANLPRIGATNRAADAFVRAVPLESLGAKTQTQAGGAGTDTMAGGVGADVMGGYASRSGALADDMLGGPARMMYDEARRRQAAMQGPPHAAPAVYGPEVDTSTAVNPSYTEARPDRFPGSEGAPVPVGPRQMDRRSQFDPVEPPRAPDRRAQFDPMGVPMRPAADVDPASGLVRLKDGTLVAPPPSAAIADELYQQGPVGARFIPPDRQIDPGVRPMPEQRPSLGVRLKNALKPGADAWAGAMQPNYDHQFLQDRGALGDVAEVITRAPHVAAAAGGAIRDVAGENIRQVAGGAANTVNTLINPWTKYVAGYESPMVENAPLGPGGLLGPKQAGTAAPSAAPATDARPAATSAPAMAEPLGARPARPPSGGGTGRVGPTVEAAKQMEVQRAAQVVGPTAAVAVEEAQKVANAPLGATDRRPLTTKQRDRAATSAMDRYTTVVVPKLIEAMVRNGDIDRAVKFQEFMEAAETKRAMKDYVHMVVAAGEQDMETFGKHFIAAYNRLGYYNDGTTIVPEHSRFTTDESGAVNGAVITFRNEATGDTYERVYDDPNQFYMVGLAAADPLNAFTETAARIKAANEAALGAKKAARDEAKSAAKDREKAVNDAAKLIFEQSAKSTEAAMSAYNPKNGGERPRPMTYAEALEEARRAFPAPRSDQPPSMGPPLLRRN